VEIACHRADVCSKTVAVPVELRGLHLASVGCKSRVACSRRLTISSSSAVKVRTAKSFSSSTEVCAPVFCICRCDSRISLARSRRTVQQWIVATSAAVEVNDACSSSLHSAQDTLQPFVFEAVFTLRRTVFRGFIDADCCFAQIFDSLHYTLCAPCEPVDFLCSDSALRFRVRHICRRIVDSAQHCFKWDACLTPDLNE